MYISICHKPRFACVRLLVVIIALSCLGLQPLASQQPVAAALDPVLQNLLSALQGSSAPATDMTITGDGEYRAGSTHDHSSVVLKGLLGGYSSEVLNFGSHSIEEIRRVDPGHLSGIHVDEKGQRELKGRNLIREPYWFSPELLVEAISRPAWDVVSKTPVSRDGVEYIDIILQRHGQAGDPFLPVLQEESRFHLLVDPSFQTIAEMSFVEKSPNPRFADVPIKILYKDYQNVQGHNVPFHIIRRVNGSLHLDLRVNQVTINQGLTESSFHPQ